MQQSNLISSVTKNQSPFITFQAEAWMATQLQARWEAGSWIYLVLLHATTDGFSCIKGKYLLWKPSDLGCQ